MAAELTLAAPRPHAALRAWRLLRVQRKAMVGGGIVLLFVPMALRAPALAPYPPTEQNFLDAMQPPSRSHWLGTDSFGQDILSRLMHGAQSALAVGFGSVAIGLLVGVPKPGLVPSPAEFYADIAKEFGIPYEDGILKSILTDSRLKSDLVHPNARGYERFAKAIAELSTPVIQLWDGILALPLVGAIDSLRAKDILETLLEAVVK